MERGVAPTPPLSTPAWSMPLVLLVFFTFLVSSTLTSPLNGSGVVGNPKTYWHQSSSKSSTTIIWILHILIGMVMVKLMSSYGCVLYTAIQECNECAESAAAVLVLVVAVSVSTEAWEGIVLKRQHWKVARYTTCLVCPSTISDPLPNWLESQPLRRGVNSYLKLAGQVVMWCAAADVTSLLFCQKLFLVG